jgi:hypothetical protein
VASEILSHHRAIQTVCILSAVELLSASRRWALLDDLSCPFAFTV